MIRVISRNVGRLAVPSLAVFGPLGLATVAGWPMLVERGLERTAVLTVVVWLLAWTVVLAATLDLASGALAGRCTPVRQAMRDAVRRLPSLVALLVVALVVVLLVAMAVAAAGEALLVLGVGALPLALAVPIVVLDRTPAARAVVRGYRVFFALGWMERVRLAGTVLVPAGVAWLLLWSTPQAAHPAMWAVCALLTPLPATALATLPLSGR